MNINHRQSCYYWRAQMLRLIVDVTRLKHPIEAAVKEKNNKRKYTVTKVRNKRHAAHVECINNCGPIEKEKKPREKGGGDKQKVTKGERLQIIYAMP